MKWDLPEGRQRRIIGKQRIKCATAAEPAVRRWIEREAARYGCSMATVWIACAEYVMERQQRKGRR